MISLNCGSLTQRSRGILVDFRLSLLMFELSIIFAKMYKLCKSLQLAPGYYVSSHSLSQLEPMKTQILGVTYIPLISNVYMMIHDQGRLLVIKHESQGFY